MTDVKFRPFLYLTPVELARIAEGYDMSCLLSDGTEVIVRRPDAEDMMRLQAEAEEKLREEYGDDFPLPPLMDRTTAERVAGTFTRTTLLGLED